MLSLRAQSELTDLVSLSRWYRCTNVLTGHHRRVFEINESRARREAAIDLGCCESKVRVELCAGLKSLELC